METNWISTVLPQQKNEIMISIKSLKNKKAPGIANIAAEVLKTDIHFPTDWLYDLFHKIWNAVTIPGDKCRGRIVKFPKNGYTMYKLAGE